MIILQKLVSEESIWAEGGRERGERGRGWAWVEEWGDMGRVQGEERVWLLYLVHRAKEIRFAYTVQDRLQAKRWRGRGVERKGDGDEENTND